MIESAILFSLIAVTNLSITLYLHRVVCHRSIALHPSLVIFFRIWLWSVTKVRIKEWVANHRYHHHASDTVKDTHSPHNTGFWSMMIYGAEYHIARANINFEDLTRIYAKDIHYDSLDLYFQKYPNLGKIFLAIILLPLCGMWTLPIWFITVNWTNFVEQRLQPAFTHYIGYRNYKTKEKSTNMLPWGIIMFGEELHNNHHARPGNWSFRAKWYEIDPAAIIAQFLIWTRLAHATNDKTKTVNLF